MLCRSCVLTDLGTLGSGHFGMSLSSSLVVVIIVRIGRAELIIYSI